MGEAVLAIRLRSLGDVVLTTPALRALKRGHPDASVEVVTERRYASLLEGLPEIARVWPLDRTASSTLALIRQLRRRRFGLAVDFFGNPRSALITAASGARHRAGYDVRGRRVCYQTRVPRAAAMHPPRREYSAVAHLRLACAVGGVSDGIEARVAVGAAREAEADRLLASSGIGDPRACVGLVPAGSWMTKTWPHAHASVLARRLMASGYPVLVISGPGESRVVERVRRLAPGVAILPPCDVGALAAVIRRIGALVGTDSGPRHLAAALGVPTFAWFGPTHPDTWNPPGDLHGFIRTDLPCRGCDRTRCPHWNCMPGLSPESVSSRVLLHLERHGQASALGPAARA